jgi:hypothetical protein
MSRYRRFKIDGGAFFHALADRLRCNRPMNRARCIAAKTARAQALSHYRKYGREFIGRPRGFHPAQPTLVA